MSPTSYRTAPPRVTRTTYQFSTAPPRSTDQRRWILPVGYFRNAPSENRRTHTAPACRVRRQTPNLNGHGHCDARAHVESRSDFRRRLQCRTQRRDQPSRGRRDVPPREQRRAEAETAVGPEPGRSLTSVRLQSDISPTAV